MRASCVSFMWVVALAVASGCTLPASTNEPPRYQLPNERRDQAIRLYNVSDQLVAVLALDGTITDSASRLVTRYDAASNTMLLAGSTVYLDQSVRVLGPHEFVVQVGPLGPWHVRVVPSNVVEVDGRPIGHVDGLGDGIPGVTRLGVLLCAIPVIDPPRSEGSSVRP